MREEVKMTKEVLTDALTGLDDDILKDYFKIKCIDKDSKRIKPMWMSAATVAAVVLILSLIMLIKGPAKDDVILYPGERPDKLYSYSINEICEGSEWNNTYHSMMFDSVYISDDLSEKAGKFIVFSGEINTEFFSFETAGENNHPLQLVIDIEREGELAKCYEADLELSESLSEVDLLFDGEDGIMKGRISLAFEISQKDFDLIKSRSEKRHYPNAKWQMELWTNIVWPGGFSFFTFDTSDVK